MPRKQRAARGPRAYSRSPSGLSVKFFVISESSRPPTLILGPVLRSSFRCRRFEWSFDILLESFTRATLFREEPLLGARVPFPGELAHQEGCVLPFSVVC